MTRKPSRNELSSATFEELFEACKNWGVWGPDDERGTLNFIGPHEVIAAASLVRRGRTISCARVLDTVAGPDNPRPALHHMTTLFDEGAGGSGDLRFAGDYLGTEIHGDAPSHMDALCHASYKGLLYNGREARDTVTDSGAHLLGIRTAAAGLVTRGVLIDLPRARSIDWLPPGAVVTINEFLRAEQFAGTELARGDIPFVRTGHTAKRSREGAWDVSKRKAGLHPEVMKLLHQRQVAALACDGDCDIAPSVYPKVPYPIHAIAIVSMGLCLIDHLDLEELAHVCRTEGRQEFMCVVAPLPITDATGSPVNPIAIF